VDPEYLPEGLMPLLSGAQGTYCCLGVRSLCSYLLHCGRCYPEIPAFMSWLKNVRTRRV